MDVSFSQLHKFEVCGAQYQYHYTRKIRPEFTSANLVFGKAVDRAFGEHIEAHAKGRYVDPQPVFEHEWEQQLGNTIVQFSANQSREALYATGMSLARQFPAFWKDSGLTAMLGPGGEPMVQQKLTVEITPGVRLRGFLDLIAMTPEGETAIIDVKTALVQAPEAVLFIGEQLTDYQILVEANADKLGLEGVDTVGFIEALKRKVPKSARGKGPEIIGPSRAPARSDVLVRERRQKIGWLVSQIKQGAFFRKPSMAYDSPCRMCDFHDLCLHGSMEGLVDPNADQKVLI